MVATRADGAYATHELQSHVLSITILYSTVLLEE